MIDPKQLRIGSRIYWKGKNEVVIEASDFAELMYYEGYFDVADPIPLTDEVLIRAGFEKELKEVGSLRFAVWHHEIPNQSIKFDLVRVFDGSYAMSNELNFWPSTIDCLHQLQNLFYCLTGTELEIK